MILYRQQGWIGKPRGELGQRVNVFPVVPIHPRCPDPTRCLCRFLIEFLNNIGLFDFYMDGVID